MGACQQRCPYILDFQCIDMRSMASITNLEDVRVKASTCAPAKKTGKEVAEQTRMVQRMFKWEVDQASKGLQRQDCVERPKRASPS